MNMTKETYAKYIDELSPKTNSVKNVSLAFLFGGAVCVVGELLKRLYLHLGANPTDAGTYATVSLIAIAALLTGLRVYDNVAKHVGAGIVVPITGFANSIVSPAMEFKSEGLVLGLAAKMFVIAGPVIVYGTVASVVYGLVYWVVKCF